MKIIFQGFPLVFLSSLLYDMSIKHKWEKFPIFNDSKIKLKKKEKLGKNYDINVLYFISLQFKVPIIYDWKKKFKFQKLVANLEFFHLILFR
jgi:hypothetical protein